MFPTVCERFVKSQFFFFFRSISCQYLAEKFCPPDIVRSKTSTTSDKSLLGTHTVCICDDDNDLEMALACQHAYIPDISSDSMAKTIAANPNHFTITFDHDSNVEGPKASEMALSLVLSRINTVDKNP